MQEPRVVFWSVRELHPPLLGPCLVVRFILQGSPCWHRGGFILA